MTTTQTRAQTVRFLEHAVASGSAKCRVHYLLDNRIDGRPCVTIYAKGYAESLRPVFGDDVRNGTDTMTDHFEKDHVDLFAGHPLYAAARKRAESVEAKHRARHAAKLARAAANRPAVRADLTARRIGDEVELAPVSDAGRAFFVAHRFHPAVVSARLTQDGYLQALRASKDAGLIVRPAA